MFLTRFQINPQRREARKILGSPHAMHAAVLSGFPDPSATEEGRVLWRLDVTGPRVQLYIVSPQQPDLNHLVEHAGWPTTTTWETKAYDPFLDRIRAGQKWAFRLTANPVHNVRGEDGGRGKPLGHVTVAQQESWLIDRQQRSGFDLTGESESPTLLVTRRETLSFRRLNAQVTLRVATYEGVLTVTDRDLLVRALAHGIGRAKGYGCGLLTLAAVR